MTQIKNFPFSLSLTQELEILQKDKNLTLVNVGNVVAKSFLISEILKMTQFQNVFWASTDEKSDSLYLNAELFFGKNILLIPEEVSLEKYYQLLEKLELSEKNLFLFEDLGNVLDKKFPTKSEIEAETIFLQKKQSIQIYELFEQLEKIGYRSAEDKHLNPQEFLKQGDQFFIYPINAKKCYRIDLFGTEIEKIETHPQGEESFKRQEVNDLEIFPAKFRDTDFSESFLNLISGCEKSCFISDDLDEDICPKGDFYKIRFTTFPREKERFFHLNFFSVLPFYTILDFVVDIKERFRREFQIVIITKKVKELKRMFKEHEIMYTENLEEDFPSTVKIIQIQDKDFLPHSFQNNDRKILFLSDREIFQFNRSASRKKSISGMNFELMNSLKVGNYVVHLDHGIAIYDGIVRRELRENEIREYLKLEYLGNDKLFVPVESAEKVSKYVGDDDPRLTKLGGNEWRNLQKKLKKETERIAKELLQLYAKREMAKGKPFLPNDDMMEDFCAAFPYELTPGQYQSWEEVRMDMEKRKPMDRLVCGDVGFGKTEIAMRAAFKCFRSGMQCAFLAPITILAEQHYQSFMKRIACKEYGINIELLSRFQTNIEQKKILKDLEHGLVDIVIGTHRLFSDDVKFKKMGLVIIDEEQRFGVQQKEKLKTLRENVDILTLTATPIPRTLHMGLNKLKDVSTITTPPPGRLPVVTEVRKYGLDLIRERILQEVARGGQVYFLHNQVQTIEAQAQQFRSLMPEVRFIVAHGQMNVHDLEERIRKFKEKGADVLIASTIIENGIDLPNANTLLVNYAEKFGLSQLYQLRGRVGRGRTQAYAFFLYHGQRLIPDAKKRLRAIVEASELGAGFQIAMKDLEIRGAGEILGASQSGSMKEAGVSHFVRLLNKTVEAMRSGETLIEAEGDLNVSVEIPLSAYIPPNYIPNADEKIKVYQNLAGAETVKSLVEIKRELKDDYGALPKEVENLCKVLRLKIELQKVNLLGIKVQKISHKSYEIILRFGSKFLPEQVFGLIQKTKNKWTVGTTSLKLNIDQLSHTWYEKLLEEISFLEIPKKVK
ncbi:transcription-repair coupling factor [Candidatus Gracilibacteria bacterium]|nr:transcription-repair coupling factor [Candidatus Gracilibacteria bacterium]